MTITVIVRNVVKNVHHTLIIIRINKSSYRISQYPITLSSHFFSSLVEMVKFVILILLLFILFDSLADIG